jgi:hypothetical protein
VNKQDHNFRIVNSGMFKASEDTILSHLSESTGIHQLYLREIWDYRGHFTIDLSDLTIICYGFHRLPKSLFTQAKNFILVDNGYIHKWTEGMNPYRRWRITMNDLIAPIPEYILDQYEGVDKEIEYYVKDIGKELRPLKKERGQEIVILPPSALTCQFLDYLENWFPETVAYLRANYSRKLSISLKRGRVIVQESQKKFPNRYLHDAMRTAHVFLSYNSNAIVDAALNGIPFISVHPLRKIGSLDDIEDPPFDRRFLNYLYKIQWTQEDMKSGKAWDDFWNVQQIHGHSNNKLNVRNNYL